MHIALTTKTVNGRLRLAIFIPSAFGFIVGFLVWLNAAAFAGDELLTVSFTLAAVLGSIFVWLLVRWVRGTSGPLDG